MNEPERIRCEEYSRALFGKSVKNNDFEDLVKGSSSFEEFRIRVVHKFANKYEHSKKVAVRWRKMREANAEMLDRLQALDAAATAQSGWRTDLDEIRAQIAEIRKNLEHLEELPSRGGNGSK